MLKYILRRWNEWKNINMFHLIREAESKKVEIIEMKISEVKIY